MDGEIPAVEHRPAALFLEPVAQRGAQPRRQFFHPKGLVT